MRQDGRTRQLNNCLRKKRYSSLAEAQRFARYRTAKSGIVFTAYECPVCYWFHLTTGGFVGQDNEVKDVSKR